MTLGEWVPDQALVESSRILARCYRNLGTRFVQFRMIKEMVRLLGDSGGKGDAKEKHISSFQAFAISIASRVGLRGANRPP